MIGPIYAETSDPIGNGFGRWKNFRKYKQKLPVSAEFVFHSQIIKMGNVSVT